MSGLAKKLSSAPPTQQRPRRGPQNLCRAIYAPDLEDYEAILEFRTRPGESWNTAQAKWDEIVGVPADRRVTNDKFRYHWKRGCGCWPDDLRLT